MENALQDFVYHFKGYGTHDSKCRVRVFDGKGEMNGKTVFLVTELEDNEGTSITNDFGRVAKGLLEKFSIKLEQAVWIEHYTERGRTYKNGQRAYLEEFDLVTLKSTENHFARPAWKRIQRQDVVKWTD